MDNKNRDKGKRSFLRKWFGEPLIHFFMLGLVVFGLHAMLEPKPEVVDDPFLVEVSSADIQWFRTMWAKRMGREPTVDELRGQVNQLIREQILSREAVSMGLDEGDPVVRRRLVQKMDFLFKDLSDIAKPSVAQLQAYLKNTRKTYEIPARVTFTHIYFNTDKRGKKAAAEAIRQMVIRLDAGKGHPLDLSSLGDPFLLPSSYTEKTLSEIRKDFGARFAEAVIDLKPQTWQGPVPSGYGLHAVAVHKRLDAMLPDFSQLKKRLATDWMADKQRELSRNAYSALRNRYRVLLEGMPYDLDMGE